MKFALLDDFGIVYYCMEVGKLLHVTNTHHDIFFVVGIVIHFTFAPREAHLQAIIHIFQYLKGMSNLTIHYLRGGDITLFGYLDSDYLGELDERCSTFGYLMSIGNSLISWKSKLQVEIAQSSLEAEYRVLAEVTKEAMWVWNLFEEIKFPIMRPITIFCDNQSCIKMAKNPLFQGRTKHIEKTCHFM